MTIPFIQNLLIYLQSEQNSSVHKQNDMAVLSQIQQTTDGVDADNTTAQNEKWATISRPFEISVDNLVEFRVERSVEVS